MDKAGGLPHVVGRPLDAGQAPNFVQKVPDVADSAEAVLEGADRAQDPAQTHAEVAGTGDDVLDILQASAGLLEFREVTLPLFGNSKTKAQQKQLT